MHNVEYKALAGLIRSFVETACNPQFRQSLFHNMLFRHHVLGDMSIDPGCPPFYSELFFNAIKKVHEQSPLNVITMSEKEWYQVLLEDYVTSEMIDELPRQLIPCHVERLSPLIDWENTWRLARKTGLGPKYTSFLYKLLHDILPMRVRLNRIKSTNSSLCMKLRIPPHYLM